MIGADRGSDLPGYQAACTRYRSLSLAVLSVLTYAYTISCEAALLSLDVHLGPEKHNYDLETRPAHHCLRLIHLRRE